jgi:hypothetical protein
MESEVESDGLFGKQLADDHACIATWADRAQILPGHPPIYADSLTCLLLARAKKQIRRKARDPWANRVDLTVLEAARRNAMAAVASDDPGDQLSEDAIRDEITEAYGRKLPAAFAEIARREEIMAHRERSRQLSRESLA